MSDLRRKYDLTRECLRQAKINTKRMGLALKKAKDDYEKAVENEAARERTFKKVSAEVDDALAYATTIKNVKGSKVKDEPAVEVEAPKPAATPKPSQEVATTAPRLPRSQRELVESFPPDKATGLQDLRQLLDLSDGGLNARIQKAMRAGLVERVAWGQYKLTEKGRACRTNRKLQLVSSEGA